MQKNISLGQLLETIASLGVIAGIIFLGFELRQNNEMLVVQAEMAVSENQTDTLLAIVLAPELIELMLKDEQTLTEVERHRLLILGLRAIRVWQGRYGMMERGLLDQTEVVQNIRSIYDRETLNYGAPLAWEFYREGLDPDFVQFFEENIVNER